MIVLLPLCLALLFFFLLRLCYRDARAAFVAALVSFQLILVMATEGLSLFHEITWPALVFLWLAVASGLGIYVCVYQDSLWHRLHANWRLYAPRSTAGKAGYIAAAVTLGVLLVLGILMPPLNVDSMTYHLPKVMFWAQNETLAVFPAHDFRLVAPAPGAELTTLHTYILSGSDHFFHSVQWIALAGCAVAASLVAGQLGGGRRGQGAAAFLVLTIPMAIMQATTTQTDLVTSFFSIAFVYFLFRLWRGMSRAWAADAFFAGAALGLAVYTKGTAYFYLLPFGLIMLAMPAFQRRWRWVRAILLMGLVALAVNAVHFQRNLYNFGTPFISGHFHLENETHTPRLLFSNIARNLSLHLVLPVEKWAVEVHEAVEAFHNLIGADLHDPDTTMGGSYYLNPDQVSHDYGGNPIHFLAILFCFGAVLLSWKRRESALVRVYTIAVIFGFLVFCHLLKWQPWHSRLHLGFFILACPVIAVELVRWLPRKAFTRFLIVVYAASLYWLFFNSTTPIFATTNVFNTPRGDLYFLRRPDLKQPFQDTAQFLRAQDPDSIGLIVGGDQWQYPLWPLLGGPLPEMHHRYVRNHTDEFLSRVASEDYRSDLFVLFGSEAENHRFPEGAGVEIVFHRPPLRVYTRKGEAREMAPFPHWERLETRGMSIIDFFIPVRTHALLLGVLAGAAALWLQRKRKQRLIPPGKDPPFLRKWAPHALWVLGFLKLGLIFQAVSNGYVTAWEDDGARFRIAHDLQFKPGIGTLDHVWPGGALLLPSYAMRLAENDLAALHWQAWFFAVASVFVVAWLAWEVSERWIAALLAGFLAAVLPMHTWLSPHAMPTVPMTAFLCAATAFGLRGWKRLRDGGPNGEAYWLAAGACLTLAASYRYEGWMYIAGFGAAAGGHWAWRLYRARTFKRLDTAGPTLRYHFTLLLFAGGVAMIFPAFWALDSWMVHGNPLAFLSNQVQLNTVGSRGSLASRLTLFPLTMDTQIQMLWGVVLAGTVAMALALRRRPAATFYLLVFVAYFVILAGMVAWKGAGLSPQRYALSLTVLAFPFAGFVFAQLADPPHGSWSRGLRWVAAAAGVYTVGAFALQSVRDTTRIVRFGYLTESFIAGEMIRQEMQQPQILPTINRGGPILLWAPEPEAAALSHVQLMTGHPDRLHISTSEHFPWEFAEEENLILFRFMGRGEDIPDHLEPVGALGRMEVYTAPID